MNHQMTKVLTGQEIMQVCPSFFAVTPIEGVSKKYAFINTVEISEVLMNMGWYVVDARESRVIDEKNRGFTRHMIRWAHTNQIGQPAEERIEIVGVNSHNRASAFAFYTGVYRQICSNGMIACTSELGQFKVRHSGRIADQVKEAVDQISSTATMVNKKLIELKKVTLNGEEQFAFAKAAHSLLYDDPNTAPIKPVSLLRTRRTFDSSGSNSPEGYVKLPKPDLWTTMNVVQENMMKGGLQGRNKKGGLTKTRKIHSIDKDVRLNKALWMLTEEMAHLKGAA